MVFHVRNRGVGRRKIFHKDRDYAAFERLLELADAAIAAPTVQKAPAPRVSDSSAPARGRRSYDPDAVDSLDGEQWVDL
jgi:hypothetical protein